MGRRATPHVTGAYDGANFRAWNDRSRANLGVDCLELVQSHCPPTPVHSTDAVYDELDVTVDEALTAIARPNVASVHNILNAFRRKPLEGLPAAAAAGVAIIARCSLGFWSAVGQV